MTPPLRADQLWQPGTFLERGVAVPFTTPALAGTRLRAATRGMELIVPHPAGGRGVYIMGCSELPHFCTPTLHDLKLSERLTALPQVTPRTMRDAAWAVAALGAAGRAARAAATTAMQADRMGQVLASAALLHRLVAQRNGAPCPAAELPVQAKAVLLQLAPMMRRPAATLTADIEALAGLLAGVALGGAAPARCAITANAIEGLVADLKQLPASVPGHGAHAVALVLSAAETTSAMARRMQAQTQALLDDVTSLLAQWATAPDRLAASILGIEWLLDGWAHTCMVWRESGIAARRGALAEMALLVPVIPKEASDVTGIPLNEAARQQLRALVLSGQDWRTGGVALDLVARNERILAHVA